MLVKTSINFLNFFYFRINELPLRVVSLPMIAPETCEKNTFLLWLQNLNITIKLMIYEQELALKHQVYFLDWKT